MDDRERLLDLLVTHSFRRESSKVFRLASGRMSDVYINCKPTTMRREGAELIAKLFEPHVPDAACAVGGLTAGADPIAYAMRDFCRRRLDAFMVRKEPKEHGLRLGVEGPVDEGMPVVIVDDVVTSGSSTIMAIQRCRDPKVGLEVAAVIVLVDRQEGGMQAIEAEVGPGVPVSAIFTMADLDRRAAELALAQDTAGSRTAVG